MKTNINENYSLQYAIEQFFRNVERSQYEQANRYYTNYSKIKDYQIDNIFVPQKIVSNIKVDYTKNSFNEISTEFYTEINDKNQFVHWKFRLIRQNDENYLISGWESITDVIVDKNGNLLKEF